MNIGWFTNNNIPWNKGKHLPGDIKLKMSLAKIGKPSNKKGKKVSEETGKKISIANTGKKRSIETRLKMSAMRKGENHWNWKGGKISDNLKIRSSIEFELWREAVFARDNWTCQECKIKGGELNAHHIKPFAYFPDLRLAIDNGLTLCKICHKDKHRNKRCLTDM